MPGELLPPAIARRLLFRKAMSGAEVRPVSAGRWKGFGVSPRGQQLAVHIRQPDLPRGAWRL